MSSFSRDISGQNNPTRKSGPVSESLFSLLSNGSIGEPDDLFLDPLHGIESENPSLVFTTMMAAAVPNTDPSVDFEFSAELQSLLRKYS